MADPVVLPRRGDVDAEWISSEVTDESLPKDLRLVVVTNRPLANLEIDDQGRYRDKPGNGGLYVGLRGIIDQGGALLVSPEPKRDGGLAPLNAIPWLVKKGVLEGHSSPVLSNDIVGVEVGEHLAPFKDVVVDGFLWPHVHEMGEQYACNPTPEQFESYRVVSRLVAENIAEELPPRVAGGEKIVVWLNDIHEWLVARELRKLCPDIAIGLFTHTPFFSPEYFRGQVPEEWGEELIEGMLGNDCLGFQRQEGGENFLHICDSLGYPVDFAKGAVTDSDGRVVRVNGRGISVDYQAIRAKVDEADVRRYEAEYRERYKGRTVICAAERIDYTKGLLEKIAALKRAFASGDLNAEDHVVVQFLQSARENNAEARKYARLVREGFKELNAEFSKTVINSEGDEVVFRPAEVFYEGGSPEQILAMARVARVGFLPVRQDGKNLVMFELAAANDLDPGQPGTHFIYGSGAGAIADIGEHVTVVDGADPEAISQAVRDAVAGRGCTEEELHRNLAAIHRFLENYTVHDWAALNLKTILRADADNAALREARKEAQGICPVPRNQGLVGELAHKIRSAKRVVLAAETDGVLAEYAFSSNEARVGRLFGDGMFSFSQLPGRTSVILSGRTVGDTRILFRKVETHYQPEKCQLYAVPLYGSEIYNFGRNRREHTFDRRRVEEVRRFADVLRDLRRDGELSPGILIDNKGPVLTIDYGNLLDPSARDAVRDVLIDYFSDTLLNADFFCRQGRESLEFYPRESGPAAALEKILEWTAPEAVPEGDDGKGAESKEESAPYLLYLGGPYTTPQTVSRVRNLGGEVVLAGPSEVGIEDARSFSSRQELRELFIELLAQGVAVNNTVG
ncbi:trehalose-6-phosphate synthase [bacterium]|nr:trehalose-6-phosphate synthase [bacterium]